MEYSEDVVYKAKYQNIEQFDYPSSKEPFTMLQLTTTPGSVQQKPPLGPLPEGM